MSNFTPQELTVGSNHFQLQISTIHLLADSSRIGLHDQIEAQDPWKLDRAYNYHVTETADHNQELSVLGLHFHSKLCKSVSVKALVGHFSFKHSVPNLPVSELRNLD
jgi:hypothetical protein